MNGETSDRRYYYVSAIDGDRKYLIAGPYGSHRAALDMVQAVKAYAGSIDRRAVFMAWGTAGSDSEHRTPLNHDGSMRAGVGV